MSKKTCFLIFAIALIALIAGFVLRLSVITKPAMAIFGTMQSPYVAGSALIAALLLQKQKHFPLLITVVAFICAIIIRCVILGGAFVLLPILYTTAGILVYVFLLALIRFIL